MAIVDALGDWSVAATAEYLADLGKQVTLIAPTGVPGFAITIYSGYALRKRLRDKKVRIIGLHAVHAFEAGKAGLEDLSVGERSTTTEFDSVIAPRPGRPEDALYRPLADAGQRAKLIGDCAAPRTALEAVFEGHETARAI